MNKRTVNKMNMMLRVRRFTREYSSEFPEGSLPATLIETFDSAVAETEAILQARQAGIDLLQSSLVRKDAAKEALVHQMRRVRAGALLLEADHPGIQARYQFDDSAPDVALIARATQMQVSLEDSEDGLTTALGDATLLPALTGALTSFKALVDDRNNGLGERIRGTRAIEAHLRQVGDLVNQLDRLFTYHLTGRPGELQEWKRTKRLRQSGEATLPLTEPTPA